MGARDGGGRAGCGGGGGLRAGEAAAGAGGGEGLRQGGEGPRWWWALVEAMAGAAAGWGERRWVDPVEAGGGGGSPAVGPGGCEGRHRGRCPGGGNEGPFGPLRPL